MGSWNKYRQSCWTRIANLTYCFNCGGDWIEVENLNYDRKPGYFTFRLLQVPRWIKDQTTCSERYSQAEISIDCRDTLLGYEFQSSIDEQRDLLSASCAVNWG